MNDKKVQLDLTIFIDFQLFYFPTTIIRTYKYKDKIRISDIVKDLSDMRPINFEITKFMMSLMVNFS